MSTTPRKSSPQIVLREGKPAAVILDIDVYQQVLERLDDLEDLRMLEELRSKPLHFRRLDDFLEECQVRV
jgi:PHD/YefM family antitoxin component YafN of YafNO toxin-antitoxin module